MKKILILFLAIYSTYTWANALVIPEETVPITKYLEQCHKTGYSCSSDFFKGQILNSQNPNFENLMINIDFNNRDFRNSLYLKIKKILSTENIDSDEAQALNTVIQKTLAYENNLGLKKIKEELSEVIESLQTFELETSDEVTYFVLKRALSKKQYLSIKYKLQYIQSTLITNYYEPQNLLLNSKNRFPLLSGSCEKTEYSPIIQNLSTEKVLPLFKSECSSTASFLSVDSTVDFLKTYKKPIIYTTIGLGLIAFFSNYKVEFK